MFLALVVKAAQAAALVLVVAEPGAGCRCEHCDGTGLGRMLWLLLRVVIFSLLEADVPSLKGQSTG